MSSQFELELWNAKGHINKETQSLEALKQKLSGMFQHNDAQYSSQEAWSSLQSKVNEDQKRKKTAFEK